MPRKRKGPQPPVITSDRYEMLCETLKKKELAGSYITLSWGKELDKSKPIKNVQLEKAVMAEVLRIQIKIPVRSAYAGITEEQWSRDFKEIKSLIKILEKEIAEIGSDASTPFAQAVLGHGVQQVTLEVLERLLPGNSRQGKAVTKSGWLSRPKLISKASK